LNSSTTEFDPRVDAIAEGAGKSPWDVFFEIAQEGAFAMPHTMSDANKIKAMHSPFIPFDTDVDPGSIQDRATFAQPGLRATGAHVVVVNGEIALEDGEQTDAKPGKVLRGPGWR
jgi:N-acyl-D-aspartate/D-glutamate deacylase